MILLYFLLAIFCSVDSKVFYYQPEQIHLAFGDSTNDIVITWSTRDDPKESIVKFRSTNGKEDKTVIGTRSEFVDGGSAKTKQYIHKVILRGLQPTSKYYYACGSSLGWSAQFWFNVPLNHSNWAPHIAIFGDMGNENPQSLGRLQEETQKELYDAIIHVGDFAYDMNSNNAQTGDEFMRQIESIAAYVPYMVCSGNHEEKYNFSNYKARFHMPGGTESLMYSFNLGPIHFIGFSTEVYYFMNYGFKTLVNQYQWLENDLKEATKLENRKQRPWIITYGHRPMYCSNNNGDDCTHSQTLVRVGLPFLHFFGLEDLFYKYGVDVEIWAHEHSYERLWPIYDFKIYNGSYFEPYTNPKAPVHLITGSAGCKEGREPFPSKIPEFSAFHSRDYGYTRLKAHNSTHLHFEQVSDDKHDNIDEITVTWSTKDNTNETLVEYGIKGYTLSASGTATKFLDGGVKQHSQYIHKVTIKRLVSNTKYYYHCGSKLGWSAEYWFITPFYHTEWSPTFAIFGDMGNENAQSLARLQSDTQQHMYDAIIHVGDFAYDMDTSNAKVGDEFMKQIETVAAYVPYMVCPGNHEEKYNFSNYRHRFNMPGQKDSLMYSFNMGPVHFISFSTEVYYFLDYGIKLLTKQFEWLENDLKEASNDENRKIRPWIITYAHRPMYCSDDKEYDCNENLETYIRQGLPLFKFFGLEDLFYKYGVDVEIWAHEHFYTRLWPIYDFKVYNGSYEEPYRNPKSPVHIITGSAGCKEGKEPFSKKLPSWNAFHTNDYGYTRLKAHNSTHLYFEQVSDDKNGAIVDSFWIIKDTHNAR